MMRAGLKEKFLSTASYKTHYFDTESDKPVIILVHGLGAAGQFQWYKQVAALSKDYRVVLLNLLHYGKSEPLKMEGCQIQDQVEYLENLRATLGLTEFFLMGLSYGGLVVAEYTHHHPQYVKHLILVDAAVKHLEMEHLNCLCSEYGASDLKDFFAPKQYQGLRRQLKAARFKKQFVPDFAIKAIHKNITSPYLKNWEKIIDGLLSKYDELSDRSYNFDQKLSIFWGRHDKIIPLSTGQALYEQFEQSELFIFEKSGHLPNIEEARKFNRTLLACLNK